MTIHAVTVIGLGDDGCLGLSSRAANVIARAQVLAGGERHLAFFPQFEGKRVIFKSDLVRAISEIVDLSHEHTVCVLASGDPLFYGIGNMIAKKIGKEYLEFIPSPTSIQLAFSRVKEKWDDATIISLHGRPMKGLVSKLQRVQKAALLTDNKNSPQVIANYLCQYQDSDWTAHVCENLGSRDEKVKKYGNLRELAEQREISDLNILILERCNPSNILWRQEPTIPYREEEAFAKRMPKNGLITKREVRVLSLAAMQLRSNSVIWDIGAGSGSVAIEAAKVAWEGEVFAIEVDPEGVEICRENILSHRTDHVEVIAGRAPEALLDLKDPDAVFVGGSKGSMGEIIDCVLKRLKPDGRIVVNAVTLDNVSEAYQAFRSYGIIPEVILLNISRGQKLANYLRYDALNPIHIFAATKPASISSLSKVLQNQTTSSDTARINDSH